MRHVSSCNQKPYFRGFELYASWCVMRHGFGQKDDKKARIIKNPGLGTRKQPAFQRLERKLPDLYVNARPFGLKARDILGHACRKRIGNAPLHVLDTSVYVPAIVRARIMVKEGR